MIVILSVLALCLSVASASLQIVPGATWTAAGTNAHIQAHGGGIIEVSGVYYWIGEDHTNGSAFQAINCYSSTNLVQWTYVRALLAVGTSGDLGPNRVVERPKIIYNSSTGKYVMWMHIDNSSYGEAKVGVATSTSVCGAYTYLSSFQPLGFQSRDMSLFKDTDGTAYLLTEDRVNGLRIDKLSSDYLSVAGATYLYSVDYEAPAMYKSGSTYFMFASHESGWAANDNQYSTATNIAGPWSAWKDFATAGSDTFDSQTAFIIAIGNTPMYMGDRWVSTNLGSSTYIWLPLTISGTTATLTNEVNWIINPSAGTWSNGPTETTPEAESSTNTLTSGAVVQSCSACSGGKDVGYIGGSAGGTITFNGISSSVATTTTIRVHYENGDSGPRYATVKVNGVSSVLAFASTGGDNIVGTSVLTVPLKAGTGNTIQFSAYKGGSAANLDRLMIPVS